MVIAAKKKNKTKDKGLLVLGLEIAAFIALCSMMGKISLIYHGILPIHRISESFPTPLAWQTEE